MQPTELRIGNLVNYPNYYRETNQDRRFRVISISLIDRNIHLQESSTCLYTEITSIQPIPLTPEILLKVGFYDNKNDEYTRRVNNYYELCIAFVGEQIICYTRRNGTELVSFKVRYLHELQNLWPLLKGTELNVDELLK